MISVANLLGGGFGTPNNFTRSAIVHIRVATIIWARSLGRERPVQRRLSHVSARRLAPSCGIFAPCAENNRLEERPELLHIAVLPSARNRLGRSTCLVPSMTGLALDAIAHRWQLNVIAAKGDNHAQRETSARNSRHYFRDRAATRGRDRSHL